MAQVLTRTHTHTQGLTQTLQNTWIAQVFETSIRTTTEQGLVDNDCCFWAHKWQSNDRNGISTCRKCWGEFRSFFKITFICIILFPQHVGQCSVLYQVSCRNVKCLAQWWTDFVRHLFKARNQVVLKAQLLRNKQSSVFAPSSVDL